MRVCTFVVIVGLLGLGGCGEPPKKTSHKSPPPARITNGRPESTTALVTLTPRAVERIGIVTVEAERRDVQRWRLYPGRVELPPGARVDVVAPATGTLLAPEGGAFPAPLARIDAGATVARVAPLLSPERQVLTEPERVSIAGRRADIAVLVRDAEAAVETARVQRDGAALILERAEKLVDRSVTRRELDRLRTAQAEADVALREAKRKRDAVAAIALDHPAGDATPIAISAGRAGMVEDVRTAPGQLVTAGSVIATVLDDSRLLLTTPVYAGEVAGLAPERGAEAVPLGGGQGFAVVPVPGPPRGDPAAATIHLHFGLDNADGRWRPGQRLGVRIRTTERETGLVVPWSAVHYDFNGGAWIYVAESDVDYRRVRVDVARRDGDMAVLHSGPQPGAKVVSVGAVELFGTEFGTGK